MPCVVIDAVSVTTVILAPVVLVGCSRRLDVVHRHGGSATFSFTVDNFTVGAAAGEGDGHIHWSIFAASDLNTPIYENVILGYKRIDHLINAQLHFIPMILIHPIHLFI